MRLTNGKGMGGPNGLPAGGGGRIAPGPKGVLKALRNLRAVKTTEALRILLENRALYGDIVRMRAGPLLIHQICGADLIRHVLVDNVHNFRRGRLNENFKPFFGREGLLTLDGQDWQRHRHMIQPLFHRKLVAGVVSLVVENVQAMLDAWAGFAGSGRSVDVFPHAAKLTLRTLSRLLFNLDLSSQAELMAEAVPVAVRAMVVLGELREMVPRWIPTATNRRIAWARKTLRGVVERVVVDPRRDGAADDLVSLLLSHVDRQTGKPLRMNEIHDELVTTFLAGYETTAVGLCWALYEISLHPVVRRRLEEEVDSVLGGRTPTTNDLAQLRYTRMVVDESLRLHPPIWGFVREAIEDDQIGGCKVPAGSSILLSPYVTHRHPDYWDDPEVFNPENFTPERSERRPRFAYLPFGGGQRLCIGSQIALVELQLAVAMIVQRFRLQRVPGHSYEPLPVVSLRPKSGVPMIVDLRHAELKRVQHPAALLQRVSG